MRWAVVPLTSQLVLPSLASAQPPSWESWGMHPMWGFGEAGMMLVMLLFWGLVIAAIVVGIRWLVHQGRGPRPNAALDILRERYARGEIDREQFLARKRDL